MTGKKQWKLTKMKDFASVSLIFLRGPQPPPPQLTDKVAPYGDYLLSIHPILSWQDQLAEPSTIPGDLWSHKLICLKWGCNFCFVPLPPLLACGGGGGGGGSGQLHCRYAHLNVISWNEKKFLSYSVVPCHCFFVVSYPDPFNCYVLLFLSACVDLVGCGRQQCGYKLGVWLLKWRLFVLCVLVYCSPRVWTCASVAGLATSIIRQGTMGLVKNMLRSLPTHSQRSMISLPWRWPTTEISERTEAAKQVVGTSSLMVKSVPLTLWASSSTVSTMVSSTDLPWLLVHAPEPAMANWELANTGSAFMSVTWMVLALVISSHSTWPLQH